MSTSVRFKIQTTDSQPIVVDFGDNTAVLAEHDTFIEHEYTATGTYSIRVTDPTRVLAIIDDESVAERKGSITLEPLTSITNLSIRNSKVEDLTINSAPLDSLQIDGNNFTTSEIDEFAITLDEGGLENGIFSFDNQTLTSEDWFSRSDEAKTALWRLEDRGWTLNPTPAPRPESYMTFYLPCDSPYYDLDIVSNTRDLDTGPTSFNSLGKSSGGVFGGYIDGTYTAKTARWTGTVAPKIMMNFQEDWTIEFWSARTGSSYYGVHLTIGDSTDSTGYYDNAQNCVYVRHAWDNPNGPRIRVVSRVGNVQKINEYRNLAWNQATYKFGKIRVCYDATLGKLKIFNMLGLIYELSFASNNFPDLRALDPANVKLFVQCNTSQYADEYAVFNKDISKFNVINNEVQWIQYNPTNVSNHLFLSYINKSGEFPLSIRTVDEGPFFIDWGDSIVKGYKDGWVPTHTYLSSAIKHVSLIGLNPENIKSIGCNVTGTTGKINLLKYSGLQSIDFSNSSFTELIGSDLTSLETADIGGSSIITLDLHDCASLDTLTATGCSALKTVDISGCNLDGASIAAILDVLDDSGVTSGTLDYSGNPGAEGIGEAGIASQKSLNAKGWCITPSLLTDLWETDPDPAFIEYTCTGASTVYVTAIWSTDSGNLDVDWGDGSEIESVAASGSSSVNHTYAGAGTYKIRILTPEKLKRWRWDLSSSLNKSATYACVSKYTKLVELQFYSCKLKQITGMEKCTDVEIISIGSNGGDFNELDYNAIQYMTKLYQISAQYNSLTAANIDNILIAMSKLIPYATKFVQTRGINYKDGTYSADANRSQEALDAIKKLVNANNTITRV